MTEPIADGPTTSFLDSLGARGVRRAEPRTSIAIAGAGCALAVLGVLIVAGDTGGGDDSFNKVPGILLSALVVAAGFFTLSAVRGGPMATAGTVAAALGVPPLMFFLTFDQDGLPPYSTEGILIVSTLVWLAAYLIGPGRGRPFFLGAGLIGAWFTLLQLTEEVFDLPYGLFGFAPVFEPGFDEDFEGGSGSFGQSFETPDPTTIGLLSLGLGVLYLLVTRRLDTQGRHGAATPFALATLPTLFVGTLALAEDLEQAGTGLLLALVGAVLAYHGSTTGRRATAWIGGATTATGAAVFLGDMSDDVTIVGMLFLAAGIGLVGAGHAIATALREPDEMELTFADPARVGRRPLVGAPYAADWAPPPDADRPVDPGHWNPPTTPEGGAQAGTGSPMPPPPPSPSAPSAPTPPSAPTIPPPPGAAPAGEAEPDEAHRAPPTDPEDPTSPPS